MGEAAGDENQEPLGWLETVRLAGSDKPVRVVLDGCEANKVFLRQADPRDGDPPRIPVYAGEQLVVMTALSHAGVHTSSDVGRTDDLLTSMRIVPVRREPGHVFARTLRHGEPDNGDRVHVRPGDAVTFEEGAVTVELDALDSGEQAAYPGAPYLPLEPAVYTWSTIGIHDAKAVLYLRSAARRLDSAALRVGEIDEMRNRLRARVDPPQELRRTLFRLIGTVELAVIALGRVCDMIIEAEGKIGCTIEVPASISSRKTDVREIRNAYEHIEDRALGQVNRKPHPDALSIFDQSELLTNDRITYGSYSLDLAQGVPMMLADARKFLKEAAGTL